MKFRGASEQQPTKFYCEKNYDILSVMLALVAGCDG
ncbi:hypothetical protein T07_10341 [Trichinella nelsoni]|uniref:Uncharacterized protein n=1 Tax=Trichinella nelsoni TaxID=6336 RepID=A0A0V0RCA1_9BILA|nr:hypothetical protein T07_10341 [Trichinella nelsoni]